MLRVSGGEIFKRSAAVLNDHTILKKEWQPGPTIGGYLANFRRHRRLGQIILVNA